MSTERKSLKSEASEKIYVTSFWGGDRRKMCLQLTQIPHYLKGESDPRIAEYVQLDRAQVKQFIADAKKWLDENS